MSHSSTYFLAFSKIHRFIHRLKKLPSTGHRLGFQVDRFLARHLEPVTLKNSSGGPFRLAGLLGEEVPRVPKTRGIASFSFPG